MPTPLTNPTLPPPGQERQIGVSRDGERVFTDSFGNTYIRDARGNQIPTDFAGVPVPGRSDLVTSNPNAHAISRHGGAVTDAQLIERARTGLTPDGVQSFIPSISSAFTTDALLRYADQSIRNSPEFQAAINAAGPNATAIEVPAVNLGINLGRGYERIRNTPNVQGPLRRVDNLTSATARYRLNTTTGQWETITIFPSRGP